VRSLLSEGRIKYPVTVRTRDGNWEGRTIIKEGPTNIILTTTAISLHGENETRLISLPTNDTAEQTKAILRQLAKGRPPEIDLGEWHDLQRWLETAEHRVVIPYAASLAESIPPVAVRLRRDVRAVLRLIETHAILHQASRERDDQGRIIATEADYGAVRALVADLISQGVGATVPDSIRQTVDCVRDINTAEGVTVREVADRLKLDRSTAQRRLQAARERGHLVNLEDKRNRPARYAVGDPMPDEIDLLPRGVQVCKHSKGGNGVRHIWRPAGQAIRGGWKVTRLLGTAAEVKAALEAEHGPVEVRELPT
jgi:hypothetical protein